MTRRDSEKQRLRRKILDAAGEMFARQGYEHVSMRKIAQRIDYSPTTIYLYFKDKAELFACLCEENFAGLIETLQRIGRQPGDPVAALKAGLRAYIDFGLEHPNHYAVTFLIRRPPETAKAKRAAGGAKRAKPGSQQRPPLGAAAFDTLRQGVAACIAAGKFPGAEVERTSQALWAGIHGLTSLLITIPKFPWVDREAVIDHLLDTLLRGLTAARVR